MPVSQTTSTRLRNFKQNAGGAGGGGGGWSYSKLKRGGFGGDLVDLSVGELGWEAVLLMCPSYSHLSEKKLYTRVLKASWNILHPKKKAGGPLCISDLKFYWRHMWHIFLKETEFKFCRNSNGL